MELDKIYIRTGLEYDMNNKKFRKTYKTYLARTAGAHARNGDFYKANRDFSEARRLVNLYLNNRY
jgi:hypothetical protein